MMGGRESFEVKENNPRPREDWLLRAETFSIGILVF